MARQINARIITRHDKEANWNKVVNFVPKLGEIIIYEAELEHITPRIKIGDGVNTVRQLPFITDPYVTAVAGKKLSTNDYTDTDKAKVDAIPENPKYTDTVYSGSTDIGIDGQTIYNKGVVDVYSSSNGTILNVVVRKGPGNTEEDYTVHSIGLNAQLNDQVRQEITEMTRDQLTDYISSGSEDGTIQVNDKLIEISGWKNLGEIAFANLDELRSIIETFPEVRDVIIGFDETSHDKIQIFSPNLWYRADQQILYYKNNIYKQYIECSTFIIDLQQ